MARGAAEYWQDFRHFRLADLLDDVVTDAWRNSQRELGRRVKASDVAVTAFRADLSHGHAPQGRTRTATSH